MGKYCSQTNGNCATCGLVNYGLDCHNNPIQADDILSIPADGIAGLSRGRIMDIHQAAQLQPGEIYID